VKNYQLSEVFGSAQLIVISPSYILVNECGETLRITNLPSSKNHTNIDNGQMVKLDFRAYFNPDSDEKGDSKTVEKIKKEVFLNISSGGYLWSSALNIERWEQSEYQDTSGFELKCVSLKRDKPKVFRVDVEKKGVSMIFRVKNEPPERMKIRNKTNHTFKINQVNYEQYGEFLGPGGDEIGFFWDDPFNVNKLTFERLFNN
jgi:hypothetical protein